MQDFIAISKEVIPLEKSAITIKNENQERRAVFEKMIQEIDLFEKEMREFIETRVVGVDSPEILEVKEKTLETSSSVALAKKNEKLADIEVRINWTHGNAAA